MDRIPNCGKHPRPLQEAPVDEELPAAKHPKPGKKTSVHSQANKKSSRPAASASKSTSVKSRKTTASIQAESVPGIPMLPDYGNNCFINSSLHFLASVTVAEIPRELWLRAQLKLPGQPVAIALINLLSHMQRLQRGEQFPQGMLVDYHQDFLQACWAYAFSLPAELPTLAFKSPLNLSDEDISIHQQNPPESEMYRESLKYLFAGNLRRISLTPSFRLQQQDAHEFLLIVMNISGLGNAKELLIQESSVLSTQWQGKQLSRETPKVNSPMLSLTVSQCHDLRESLAVDMKPENTDTPLSWQVSEPGGTKEVFSQTFKALKYQIDPEAKGLMVKLNCYVRGKYLKKESRELLKATPEQLTLPIRGGGTEQEVRLQTVLCHKGSSLGEGHYTVIEKQGDHWVFINDLKRAAIRTSSLAEALDKAGTPYLLYYQYPQESRSAESMEVDSGQLANRSEQTQTPTSSGQPTLQIPPPIERRPSKSIEMGDDDERVSETDLDSDMELDEQLSPEIPFIPAANPRVPEPENEHPESLTVSIRRPPIQRSEPYRLSDILHQKMKSFACRTMEDAKALNTIKNVAQDAYPIPRLRGLRRNIKGWDNYLARYVCQQAGIDLSRRPYGQRPQSLAGLFVLEPGSLQYAEVFQTVANEWFAEVPSLPNLCRRLNYFEVKYPYWPGMPVQKKGEPVWNLERLKTVLAHVGALPDYADDSDCLINEFIDAINKGQDPIVLRKRYLQPTPGTGSEVHPGYEPRLYPEFRKDITNWSMATVRYFAQKHRDIIEQRTGKPLPATWELTALDKLTLFPHTHPQYQSWVEERIRELSHLNLHGITGMLSSQHVLIPQSEFSRGQEGTWNWRFPLIMATAKAAGIELKDAVSSYRDTMTEMKTDQVANVRVRLIELAKSDPAFKPPALKGVRPEIMEWTAPFIRTVIARENIALQEELHEQLKVTALDQLKLFIPDSKPYREAFKQLLIEWRDENIGFYQMLRTLNRIERCGRDFYYQIPGHPSLEPAIWGSEKWTAERLEQVITTLGVDGIHNYGNEAADLIYSQQIRGFPLKNVYQPLKNYKSPIPAEMQDVLNLKYQEDCIKSPTEGKWTYRTIRVAILLYIAKDAEAQSKLPEDYRVTKSDLNLCCKKNKFDELMVRAGLKK